MPDVGSKATATTTSEVTVRGRGHLGNGGRAQSQRWRLDLGDGKLGGNGDSRCGLEGDDDGEQRRLRGDGGRRTRDEGSEVNWWEGSAKTVER